MIRLGTYLLFGLALLVAAQACNKSPHEPEPEVEVKPISENNKVIYEVNLRNYSAAGNIIGLKNDLPRLQSLGVDILWLMPIHPIGQQNRLGSKGSPYSVRDYKAIHPDFGTADDFKALVAAAHEAGMEIWLDWVANHTAWDHAWVAEHPDYYAANQAGVRPYSPMNWTDVIQLDFNNPAMRAAMIEAMKYWVVEFDIDGYRCDAATLFIPLSFWTEARTAVDAVKPIKWLCEGDNPAYMPAFDFDYAWAFNNALNDFGINKNLSQLKTACNTLFHHPSYAHKGRMVYLSNHDLNAYEGTEFQRYGSFLLPLTVLYFTIYDLPLIYNGQEVGLNKSMGLFEVSRVEWSPVNPVINRLFKKLTALKRTQKALESGSNRGSLFSYTTTNDANVYAYSRKRDENEVLILLNFSNAPLTLSFTGSPPSGLFTDFLESGKMQFTAQTQLSLPAFGFSIYVK